MAKINIEYKQIDCGLFTESIKEIFAEEAWSAYLKDDEKLIRAFKNTLYSLGAFEHGKLIAP